MLNRFLNFIALEFISIDLLNKLVYYFYLNKHFFQLLIQHTALIAMMKEAYTDGSLGEIKKFTIALKQFCWRWVLLFLLSKIYKYWKKDKIPQWLSIKWEH